MRFWKDESGQAFVMAVLFMTFLLAFMALAVDVGVLFRAKRNVQAAADAAALAAAVNYKYQNPPTGSTAAAYSAAYYATQNNGYMRGSKGVVVTAKIPPTTATYHNCSA